MKSRPRPPSASWTSRWIIGWEKFSRVNFSRLASRLRRSAQRDLIKKRVTDIGYQILCYEILLIIDDQYWLLHHIMHDQWWSCYDITADHRWSVLIGASYHDPYLWAIWNIVWWRKKQGNVLCCTWGRPLSLQLTCTALAFLQLCKYRLSRKLWNTLPPC